MEGLPGLGPDTGFVLQRAKWQCAIILCGKKGHPWGRFGAALTVLGDVNGDKLTDVAIGAPGEQKSRGAVYLFHGTSGLGINPSYRQVRPLSAVSPSSTSFSTSQICLMPCRVPDLNIGHAPSRGLGP